MKLGCQSAPTNETHLKYFARYGVRNICGYPHDRRRPPLRHGRRTQEHARPGGEERHRASIAWRRHSSRPATSTARSTPPSCWRRVPERDRDIESMQTLIRNCAAVGHSVDQVQHEHPGRAAHRAARRAAAMPSTAPGSSRTPSPKPPLTRAGKVNADMFWERDYVLPGARHPGGGGEQDPHGVPSARSRACRRKATRA